MSVLFSPEIIQGFLTGLFILLLIAKKFEFTDEGDMSKYLVVDIIKHKDGSIEFTQPHLIDRFVNLIGQDKNINIKLTPVIKPLLCKDLEGLQRKHSWNYRQAIGILTYLQDTTRPNVTIATHQIARFPIDLKLSHERAVHRIGRYLKGTSSKGLIFRSKKIKGLEFYVDADFAGELDKADASNPEAVMSRTGYVINDANFPVLRCSKLQSEIVLSTTEAEYIALSQSMREVIPFMHLLQEANKIFSLNLEEPKFHCKVFEDNNSCIVIATSNKFSPRTKHIAINNIISSTT